LLFILKNLLCVLCPPAFINHYIGNSRFNQAKTWVLDEWKNAKNKGPFNLSVKSTFAVNFTFLIISLFFTFCQEKMEKMAKNKILVTIFHKK